MNPFHFFLHPCLHQILHLLPSSLETNLAAVALRKVVVEVGKCYSRTLLVTKSREEEEGCCGCFGDESSDRKMTHHLEKGSLKEEEVAEVLVLGVEWKEAAHPRL